MKKLSDDLKSFDRLPGIYIVENCINGKKYVGMSMNINERISYYKWLGKGSRRVFENAIRKYGHSSFFIEVMYFPDIEYSVLENIEQIFINLEKSSITEHGYNVCEKGRSAYGIKRSQESIDKSSNARRGAKRTHEQRVRISKALMGRTVWNKGLKKEKPKKEKSVNTHNKKSIIQYNLNGDIVKRYESAREAWRETGVLPSKICAVCKCYKQRKSAGGFIWKYESNF